MNNPTLTGHFRFWAGLLGATLLAAPSLFGLAAAHPDDQEVSGSSAWTDELRKLVNSQERSLGYFVNAEDIFFYKGSAEELNAFLRLYAAVDNVEHHWLVVHEGGEKARFPWQKEGGGEFQWKLYVAPKGWLTHEERAVFVGHVHVWTKNGIDMDSIQLPEKVKKVTPERVKEEFEKFRAQREARARQSTGEQEQKVQAPRDAETREESED